MRGTDQHSYNSDPDVWLQWSQQLHTRTVNSDADTFHWIPKVWTCRQTLGFETGLYNLDPFAFRSVFGISCHCLLSLGCGGGTRAFASNGIRRLAKTRLNR